MDMSGTRCRSIDRLIGTIGFFDDLLRRFLLDDLLGRFFLDDLLGCFFHFHFLLLSPALRDNDEI